MDSVGNLEKEALKRKERLRNLRKRTADNNENEDNSQEKEKLPKVYSIRQQQLQQPSMDSVGNLEKEALKRKERLRNLRKRTADNNENEDNSQEKEKLPKPVFRSYKPLDDSLKDNSLPSAKPSDVNEHIQSQIEASKSEKIVDEVELVNLAPRKPDWDLKRDVAKKLEKLERRTQRAIAELIRERLKTGSGDLAQVVNVSSVDNSRNMDDDED